MLLPDPVGPTTMVSLFNETDSMIFVRSRDEIVGRLLLLLSLFLLLMAGVLSRSLRQYQYYMLDGCCVLAGCVLIEMGQVQ